MLDSENLKKSLKVYCRFRALSKTDIASTYTTDGKSVTFSPTHESESKYKTRYQFADFFDQPSTQQEIFRTCCLPLIHNLFLEQDSLIFIYGVTGSGKTFTMTGTDSNPGVLPYSINYLFNSIESTQMAENILHPDGQNGFVFQPVKSKASRYGEMPLKKTYGVHPPLERVPSTVTTSTEDMYSVFVSYIEIYNNYIYDLLDDDLNPSKGHMGTFSKSIREDKQRRCYVQNAVELEVHNYTDTMDLLTKGNKRRKMCETALNLVSSRSHVIFTIKLIKIHSSSKKVTVNHISFVDLAGSERPGRTMNEGVRMREAGCINNSLMVLRNCIECLRDNQRQHEQKMIPYRNTKLTTLFKSYFDGQGTLSMIVCCNPSVPDYDENMKVMQFAEIAQQVEIKGKAVAADICTWCNKIPVFSMDYQPMEFRTMEDVDTFCAILDKVIAQSEQLVDKVGHFSRGRMVLGENNVLPSTIAARERGARIATPIRPGALLSKTPMKTNRVKSPIGKKFMTPAPKRCRFIP